MKERRELIKEENQKDQEGTETKTVNSKQENYFMQEVAKGNKVSFSLLLKDYLSIAIKNTKRFFNEEISEEIVQDVFLKIWVNAPSFNEEKGNFKNWFYKILFNTINSKLRKKKNKKLETKNTSLLKNNENIEEDFFKKEKEETLNYLLKKLPETQRNILILKYYEDYSYKDISKITGKTTKAIENIIFKAKKSLNSILRRNSL
jgi:RNA polymerase sigma-70 factor, ECF subfamily